MSYGALFGEAKARGCKVTLAIDPQRRDVRGNEPAPDLYLVVSRGDTQLMRVAASDSLDEAARIAARRLWGVELEASAA